MMPATTSSSATLAVSTTCWRSVTRLVPRQNPSSARWYSYHDSPAVGSGADTAFVIGLAAQGSLLASGLLASWVKVPRRVVGALAAFGAGALVSAITFDLTVQARLLGGSLSLWLLLGAIAFVVGDLVVERRFGSEGSTAALGIVLGSVVDGVPESLILGMSVATGNMGGRGVHRGRTGVEYSSSACAFGRPHRVRVDAQATRRHLGGSRGGLWCGRSCWLPHRLD
jgi:hypothetical protein